MNLRCLLLGVGFLGLAGAVLADGPPRYRMTVLPRPAGFSGPRPGPFKIRDDGHMFTSDHNSLHRLFEYKPDLTYKMIPNLPGNQTNYPLGFSPTNNFIFTNIGVRIDNYAMLDGVLAKPVYDKSQFSYFYMMDITDDGLAVGVSSKFGVGDKPTTYDFKTNTFTYFGQDENIWIERFSAVNEAKQMISKERAEEIQESGDLYFWEPGKQKVFVGSGAGERLSETGRMVYSSGARNQNNYFYQNGIKKEFKRSPEVGARGAYFTDVAGDIWSVAILEAPGSTAGLGYKDTLYSLQTLVDLTPEQKSFGLQDPWSINSRGEILISVFDNATRKPYVARLTPVPEPACLVALGIGCLVLRRRK